jgi:hypothetical protein
MDIKLEKSQTGIASEFYVAGELSRVGYNVTLTFGNTKAIDLLVQKNNKVLAIQVKGIQSTKSGNWNLDKSKLTDDPNLFIVLVNLHIDNPSKKPEFFILTSKEALTIFKDTLKDKNKRTYLDYQKLKKMHEFEDRWKIFDEVSQNDEGLWRDFTKQKFVEGYSSSEPEDTLADIKEPNPDYMIPCRISS